MSAKKDGLHHFPQCVYHIDFKLLHRDTDCTVNVTWADKWEASHWPGKQGHEMEQLIEMDQNELRNWNLRHWNTDRYEKKGKRTSETENQGESSRKCESKELRKNRPETLYFKQPRALILEEWCQLSSLQSQDQVGGEGRRQAAVHQLGLCQDASVSPPQEKGIVWQAESLQVNL